MTYRLVAFVVESIELPFHVTFLSLENFLWRVKEMAQWLKHEDLGLDPRTQWHTFVILTLKGAGKAEKQAGPHSSLF